MLGTDPGPNSVLKIEPPAPEPLPPLLPPLPVGAAGAGVEALASRAEPGAAVL